jgi:hypothetical protein
MNEWTVLAENLIHKISGDILDLPPFHADMTRVLLGSEFQLYAISKTLWIVSKNPNK